ALFGVVDNRKFPHSSPNPSSPLPAPHASRRRRPAEPMAKTRPPKKILESYTIKGSDKVIKR
uniref:Uncharacterized protein n=1 Tax=Aegilops tauschii subsp. strangulata TaxID=200361 RepID=A0A452XHG6_AEGTS